MSKCTVGDHVEVHIRTCFFSVQFTIYGYIRMQWRLLIKVGENRWIGHTHRLKMQSFVWHACQYMYQCAQEIASLQVAVIRRFPVTALVCVTPIMASAQCPGEFIILVLNPPFFRSRINYFPDACVWILRQSASTVWRNKSDDVWLIICLARDEILQNLTRGIEVRVCIIDNPCLFKKSSDIRVIAWALPPGWFYDKWAWFTPLHLCICLV